MGTKTPIKSSISAPQWIDHFNKLLNQPSSLDKEFIHVHAFEPIFLNDGTQVLNDCKIYCVSLDWYFLFDE